MAELMVFAIDRKDSPSTNEFVSKTLLYLSFLQNEDAKVRLFQHLKQRLDNFWQFAKEHNITIE